MCVIAQKLNPDNPNF